MGLESIVNTMTSALKVTLGAVGGYIAGAAAYSWAYFKMGSYYMGSLYFPPIFFGTLGAIGGIALGVGIASLITEGYKNLSKQASTASDS